MQEPVKGQIDAQAITLNSPPLNLIVRLEATSLQSAAFESGCLPPPTTPKAAEQSRPKPGGNNRVSAAQHDAMGPR